MTRDPTARRLEPGTLHGVPTLPCGGVTALRSRGLRPSLTIAVQASPLSASNSIWWFCNEPSRRTPLASRH